MKETMWLWGGAAALAILASSDWALTFVTNLGFALLTTMAMVGLGAWFLGELFRGGDPNRETEQGNEDDGDGDGGE